jgi:hypothetical protein
LESFPNKNRLLSAALNDIQENVFLAELKALGIINKIITCASMSYQKRALHVARTTAKTEDPASLSKAHIGLNWSKVIDSYTLNPLPTSSAK